jgi:hypothetical protein
MTCIQIGYYKISNWFRDAKIYGDQQPEVGYWILRWDTRILNSGIPEKY